MSAPVKLRLYCSICARNDYYMERIRTIADSLGLNYTLEKITDDGAIDRRGLQVPCMYAYCPGCRITSSQLKEDDPDARCTPALEIDGVLRFWDTPAADGDLREALTAPDRTGASVSPPECSGSPKILLDKPDRYA